MGFDYNYVFLAQLTGYTDNYGDIIHSVRYLYGSVYGHTRQTLLFKQWYKSE